MNLYTWMGAVTGAGGIGVFRHSDGTGRNVCESYIKLYQVKICKIALKGILEFGANIKRI
jgi:hypothetical protein